ncbi:MAG TPA: hypothetical protein PKH81_00195 [Treponemataceae bacterium]|nr:hypothetical protein [Treponemataceae bacterium]
MGKIRKFINILKVEIEDMQEDCEHLIEQSHKKREQGLYTDYVLMENVSVYRSQIDALTELVEKIEEEDWSGYNTVEEASNKITTIVPQLIKKGDFPEYTIDLVSRKMEKILQFLELSC